MIVVVCPGQGSQTPGFLSPWLELEGARERLAAYADAAQLDLLAAGTEWDADRIRDTSVAQPLIVAASLLSWHALTADGARPSGVAGHSVGELAALAAAGVVSDQAAMTIVGARGRAMAEAAALADTGMSAVVGGVEEQVLEVIAAHDLEPANYNGGGQIVAAGTKPGLAALAENAPRGARVIPLQVAGAFHTRHMALAKDALQAAVDEASGVVADPTLLLWSNSDGRPVGTGARALELIVHQVASPVRWDLCMASFADHGVTGIIELAPAGALVGLAKRGLKGVPAVAVKTPEDLEAARELLAAA
ncbi:ACP S-malonyltransferase [Microbacterium sediminis]|uniref:[acyl-carrier-protein] S-malonyltransferase n=1 Tax=Microbacterium sediminis TaxID=904291 RepID=A0A1B9NGT5_9MICO|nr:ACP S-malonyltransferase [Microbacterium sediminis]OCG75783.1 ACP S-malonyltransferase [Microbacterium sediminis]QBR74177.1 ACP S-malonyltransferase [Microbacterium sediminis]